MEVLVSGKTITKQQERIYMSAKNEGHIQLAAAAKAGISERSGRRIEKGDTTPGVNSKRPWRTRKDPFACVWQSEIVPMLEQNVEFLP